VICWVRKLLALHVFIIEGPTARFADDVQHRQKEEPMRLIMTLCAIAAIVVSTSAQAQRRPPGAPIQIGTIIGGAAIGAAIGADGAMMYQRNRQHCRPGSHWDKWRHRCVRFARHHAPPHYAVRPMPPRHHMSMPATPIAEPVKYCPTADDPRFEEVRNRGCVWYAKRPGKPCGAYWCP
jgi:hypothetical protein